MFFCCVSSSFSPGIIMPSDVSGEIGQGHIDRSQRVAGRPAGAYALDGLSNKELIVMQMLVRGMSNKEIADALYISNKTVSTYKTRLMNKLGVRSLVELVDFARKQDAAR